MTRHVALLANYSWAGITSPLINTAGYLIERGYSVDLYLERPDLDRFPLPHFITEAANVIVTRGPGRGILSDIQFAATRGSPPYRYVAVIAFDYQAILRGWFLNKLAGGTLIYHNLEFLLPAGLRGFRNKLRERLGARYAKFVVTQDDLRSIWLSRDLRLSPDKFRVVSNSSRGLTVTGDSGYFRRTFKIDDDKRIVLCIGSMISEHFVEELTASATSWNDGFVLVLHGWFPDARLKRALLRMQQQAPERIFISERLFDDTTKFIPFLSCDIGFVGFDTKSPNHKFAAGSAGKLFDFMKAQKPILARDTPGVTRLVQEQQIGVTFTSTGEIQESLSILVERYEGLRRNCVAAFPLFEFDHLYSPFWREVLADSGVPQETAA